jgi:hypothetical protein
METKYVEFQLVLGNGEQCRVRYCDEWGVSLFGTRTIHFEFLGCLTVSHTRYRSEFRIIGKDEKIDPKEAAMRIIEKLTGINFSGEKVQLKLL